MSQTIDKIMTTIENKECIQHIFLNANKINLMQDDVELTKIVNQSQLINADGASIIWAGKQLGIPINERITGIDLFVKLIKIANDRHLKIFLFGGKQEVIEKVSAHFMKEFPSLEIVGIRNGYFTKEQEPEIVEQIVKSNADMLFVGFSSPQKEFWINRNLNKLNIPLSMGVGGSFDVVAGVVKRAPVWMQKHGLEWLFRFIQEPRRMWKRYFVGNIKFIALIYREKWRNPQMDRYSF